MNTLKARYISCVLWNRLSVIKMKNIKYYTVGIVPKPNIKIVERRKTDTPKTQIHDRPLSWPDTGISIKSAGVKLVLFIQTKINRTILQMVGWSSLWVIMSVELRIVCLTSLSTILNGGALVVILYMLMLYTNCLNYSEKKFRNKYIISILLRVTKQFQYKWLQKAWNQCYYTIFLTKWAFT